MPICLSLDVLLREGKSPSKQTSGSLIQHTSLPAPQLNCRVAAPPSISPVLCPKAASPWALVTGALWFPLPSGNGAKGRFLCRRYFSLEGLAWEVVIPPCSQTGGHR